MNNNEYLTKIVAASLLGDGHVSIPPDGSINAHYILSQISEHKDYVDFIAAKLSKVTNVRIQTSQPKVTDTMKAPKEQLRLITRVHPFYTKFRNRMYPNGHKVIDPHYLTLIDFEFLAILYQEDGTIVQTTHKKGYQRKEAFICTLSFSYADNMLLSKAIYEKTGIITSVHKHHSKGKIYYKLYLSSKTLDKFMSGIEPYIVDTFRYKLFERLAPLNKGDDIVGSI